MRILLTGGTGKLGNAVARMLVEADHQVVALVRDLERGRSLLPEGVERAPGDVVDPLSLQDAAEGCAAAINCMGIFEQWVPELDVFNRVNAQGAFNVARAARLAGAKRFIHTSTFDVFDAPRGGTVSEDRLADYEKGTAYERSKQLAERLVLGEAEQGIDVVIMNPAGIFGPTVYAAEGLDSMFRDTIRGRLPAIPPGGLSLVYVEDAAAAHVAALEAGRPGERYILAGGFATLQELCEAAVESAGRGRVPWRMPERLARGVATAGEKVADLIGRPPLIGEGAMHFMLWQARADSSKARAELGFDPTPWREGVERTVRWLADGGRI